ncbi:MAG: smalltalk protein [Prevotella sp.]|nr:smalltalk protein [Prevotella sp.]MDE6646486.1 smalltalk protein [Prevotella sp.]MDE7085145.1 smalltalk protein [Prevotella sp.]
MKRETWKQLIQLLVTILTAVSSSLFVQSCAALL